MVRFTKAAGTGPKLWFRRFFYVLFRGLLYLAMYLRANGDYTFSNLRPENRHRTQTQHGVVRNKYAGVTVSWRGTIPYPAGQ